MQKATAVSSEDLEWIGEFAPGKEPILRVCADGPRRGAAYPVAETRFAGNERLYLDQCIDTNWISSRGAFVDRFERAFAGQAGCGFAVACTSGTSALHLVMAALGVGPGDEVIVPAFAMIAVANSVRYTGATVKLVDSEAATLNIDASQIEAAITSRTKAIIVVHTYGHPADMDAIKEITDRRGIHLVEDAAEAHGAEISGRRVGGLGIAGTFSFYANKIITTGEGGMVTTNNVELEQIVRRLRDHAFHAERHFWHEYVGFNYRMTNLQAAVGLAQTERFDEIVAARRRLRQWYEERLRTCRGLVLPLELPGMRSVFWMYGVRVQPSFSCDSSALRMHLADRGVETRSFFVPMHAQPIYIDQFRGQRFPIAEELCRTGLYLPTHENLTEEDVDWICEQILDVDRHGGGAP